MDSSRKRGETASRSPSNGGIPTLEECAEELRSAKLFDLRSTVHLLSQTGADQWVGMRPAAPNVIRIYAQIRTVYSKDPSMEALQQLIAGPFEGYFKLPRIILSVSRKFPLSYPTVG
jgi:hypothetical protein